MKATRLKASYLAAVTLSLLIAACGKPTEPPVPVTAPSADPAAPGAGAPSPSTATPAPETPAPAATPPSPADTQQNAPSTPNGRTPPDTTEKPQPMPSGQPAPTPSSDASQAPPAPAGGVTPVAANAAGGNIIAGWKTWRSAACERCHGAAQEGMVGPSLIESLKRLSKDEVRKTVLEGRLERGMPGHPYLADKFDDLYAYLKGRSDGSVPKVRPEGA